MNLETVDVWVRIIQGVGTLGVWIYVWWTNRKYKSAARFVKVEESILNTKEVIENRLDAHADRLTEVESAWRHAPGHGDLGKVYERVNGISDQVKEMAGGQAALQRSVDMIHEHLLSKGGGQ